MCGICGLWTPYRDSRATVDEMVAALRHRGPDGAASWGDQSGIHLGHARLSIIDLSQNGAQPMISSDGRWVIVFNGEIYNHQDLRDKLVGAGCKFRGASDTESLLEYMAIYGPSAVVRDAIGMWAFAAWDREARSLYLCRDRIGEKPLYYFCGNGNVAFASEIKALRRYPGLPFRLNLAAVPNYLRHGYIGGERSIVEGVHKLPAATMLTVTEQQVITGNLAKPVAYWSLRDAISLSPSPKFGSIAEAAVDFECRLKGVIKSQLVADVPVGAFLSGGVDSSTIVSLAQQISSKPIRTYCVGFSERWMDESPYARRVALHLGTDHRELIVSAADARDLIPRLAQIWDEPFADASQIPTLLVARFARSEVKVCLSGDGGDELFCGYDRYAKFESLWSASRFISPALAESVSAMARSRVGEMLDNWSRFGWPEAWRGRVGSRIAKLAWTLAARKRGAAYKRHVSYSTDFELRSLGQFATQIDDDSAYNVDQDGMAALAMIDSVTYLPDDILVKLDRATMSVGLEGRIPLLDRRIVEWAVSLPQQYKAKGGEQKRVLRRILEKHIPPMLVNRPKQGFGLPLSAWLRGPLRAWVEEMLSPACIRSSGIWNEQEISRLWSGFVRGRDHAKAQLLWNILMFQAWTYEYTQS